MQKKKLKNLGVLAVAVILFALPTAAALNTNGSEQNYIPSTLTTQANIQISSNQNDEQHPTIAGAYDGSIVVGYDRPESSLESHIYFHRSTNNGNSWSEIWNTDNAVGEMDAGLQLWPVLVSIPGGNALFGAFTDEVQNLMFTINVTDPSDPLSYEENLGGYDESGWDYDRHTFTIEAYSQQRMAIGHVGHIEFSGYDLPLSSQMGVLFEGYDGGISKTGDEDYPLSGNCEIALTDTLDWYIFDIPDAAPGTPDIIMKYGNTEEEGDAHLWPEIEYTFDADAKDPAFDGSGRNLVMVYMTNDNVFGDWDLAVKYSNDEGVTWQDGTFPSTPQVDEVSPEIFLVGQTVFCTYVSGNNLFLTKSTDLGQTWEDPEQVNDVNGYVVEDPGAVEVSQAGIVWEDTRNGNIDIYYAPLPAAIINIGIAGGFGVSASISNDGTVAAENLAWTVDLSGLVFVGGHSEGTITSLAPGSSESVGPGLVLGLGPTTISVDAGGTIQTADAMVLGPLVVGL